MGFMLVELGAAAQFVLDRRTLWKTFPIWEAPSVAAGMRLFELADLSFRFRVCVRTPLSPAECACEPVSSLRDSRTFPLLTRHFRAGLSYAAASAAGS